jgi:2',3'-cyclic-nucleotide 2'-phosphodiesterase (5'-nucleotidase family)
MRPLHSSYLKTFRSNRSSAEVILGSILTILHTNDLHGLLDERRVEGLQAARKDADLYFDTGDAIKTGNLGIPLKQEPVWQFLASLDCTASVPGNRESHILKSAFEAKIAGHRHPILCANLYDKEGSRLLPASLTVKVREYTVGILGVMVPMVTERMKSKALSQMIWTAPIPEALKAAKDLRQSCDLVIALTHIGMRQDQVLAESGTDIDLILGGHSHTILQRPTQVGSTWICQGGSHGRFYGRYEWTIGEGLTGAELVAWGKGIPLSSS